MSDELLGGRYRLESVLGRGGMATVWRGVDTRLGRPVAVKVLATSALADPAAKQRFHREALTVARLSNPHLVAVHDADVDGEPQYLVMELIEGTNLAALLAHGPMDVSQAAGIAVQVCDALTAAHAVGVVHRDIKPGNILIDRAGTVKVCDFGIARLAGSAQHTLTSTGAAIGTSQYMAPEQVSGGPVDARTDLYALGCVLYAMLTGSPPFGGDAPLAVIWQQLHKEPDPVSGRRPDLPQPVAQLVGALLAKSPDERPQSAAEVRAALAPIAAGAVPAPAAATAPATTPIAGAMMRGSAPVVSPTRALPIVEPAGVAYPPVRRRPWWPAAIAAVAAIILVAFVVAALSDKPGGNGGTGAAGTSPATTTTTTATTPRTTPTTGSSAEQTGDQTSDPVGALRQAVAAQAAAGQINADAADEIGQKLDDLAQAQSGGKQPKVASKTRDLVHKLDELHQDGKITDAGWAVIEPIAAQLTGAPQGGGETD